MPIGTKEPWATEHGYGEILTAQGRRANLAADGNVSAASARPVASLAEQAFFLGLVLVFGDNALVPGFLEVDQFLAPGRLAMFFVFADGPSAAGNQASDDAEGRGQGPKLQCFSFHNPSRFECLGLLFRRRTGPLTEEYP